MISWFLSWVSDGLIALKWWVGKEQIRLGHPKFDVKSLDVNLRGCDSCPCNLPACQFLCQLLLWLAVCWVILLSLDTWLLLSLFSCCKQAALRELSVYKPVALFSFGFFPKVRYFWCVFPKVELLGHRKWMNRFMALAAWCQIVFRKTDSLRLSPATYKCTYYPTSWPALKFIILIYLCCFNRDM